jgi:cell division GTPase FtsZ
MLFLIGIGGAGSKIVDSFYKKNVVKKIISRIQTKGQREFVGIAVDTSEKLKSLSNIPPGNTVLIGKSSRKIAKEELVLVMNKLRGVVTEKPWAIVLFAGLGGGTGTGALPVIAKKVKETYKCKTLGVFVLPSSGEGRVYTKNTLDNLDKILSSVDGSIILDNNVVTDRGEDILSAHKIINQHIQGFFRLIDEGFLEKCFKTQSTIGYYKLESDHVSIKEAVERMLRDYVFLKFDMEKSEKIIFVARGNLDYLYGHDFAQGWAKNKFGIDLEYEFYDESGARLKRRI